MQEPGTLINVIRWGVSLSMKASFVAYFPTCDCFLLPNFVKMHKCSYYYGFNSCSTWLTMPFGLVMHAAYTWRLEVGWI